MDNKKKLLIMCLSIIGVLILIFVIVFISNRVSNQDSENSTEASGEIAKSTEEKTKSTDITGASSYIESQSEDAEGNRYIEIVDDDGQKSVIVIHNDPSAGPNVEVDGTAVATSPAQPDAPTQPQPTNPPTLPPTPAQDLTYEEYIVLSSQEQYNFFQSFENPQLFMNWYNYAIAVYQQKNPSIIINPGDVIDLGGETTAP